MKEFTSVGHFDLTNVGRITQVRLEHSLSDRELTRWRGSQVRVDGQVRTIRAIERYCILNHHAGEVIGLLLED